MTPEISGELSKPLDPRRIAQLTDGPAKGAKYLAVADVLYTANRIFGYGGWSFDIVTPPFVLSPGDADGKGEVWACVGRVTVGDASFADMGTNVRSGRGPNAVEMASKGAVSDAIKRCLTCFGDQFGLVLRDKTVSGTDIERWWEEENKPAPQATAPAQLVAAATSSTLTPLGKVGELLKARGESVAVLTEVIPIDAITRDNAGDVITSYLIAERLTPQQLIERLDKVRESRTAATAQVAADPALSEPKTNHERATERLHALNLQAGDVSLALKALIGKGQFTFANIDEACDKTKKSPEDLVDYLADIRRNATEAVGAAR